MPTQTTDLELLALERAAILLLANGTSGVNSVITARTATWASEDSTFYTAIGRPNPNITVESIAAGNFYPGHIPSLIEAPLDRYPNIAAIASRGDNIPSTDDWAEQYAIGLAIEIMCKAVSTSDTPDQEADALAAEIVNARIKRTVEAALAVFKTDNGRNFNKVVPTVGNTPNVITTDVVVRSETNGRGPRWLWAGARIDFRVQQWVNY